MQRDRWRRIEELFHRAVRLPASERDALLDSECDDDALRGEVERLLTCDGEPDEFIDTPALLLHADTGEPNAPDPTDSLIGETVGAYRIVERIAAGGMGIVFKAVHQDPDIAFPVAIKLVRRGMDSERILQRFQTERRTLSNLSHPNVARLLDGGRTATGAPYLVMEYIEGQPIDEYCDQRCLSVKERLELFRVVCSAVHHAHKNLVVHRDLKPSNILVTAEGVPKLLDFGIAKVLALEETDAPVERTATLERVLTPEYASPEQIRGEPVTTGTDVYALGVILYGLLSGRRPYRLAGEPLTEIERTICEREPVRPSTAVMSAADDGADDGGDGLLRLVRARATTPERLRRSLRGDLDNIVLRAMRKDPSRRYDSAEQLAEDIRRYLKGLPVLARRETLLYLGWKFVRRHRISTLSVALALLVLVGATVVTARNAHVASVQRDAARRAERRAEAEASHAGIEAKSATELASFLTDILLSTTSNPDHAGLAEALDQLRSEQQRVEMQYADQGHIQANLLDAIGHVHLSLESLEPARDLIERAAGIREREFGRRNVEVARSLNSLGELCIAEGEYEAAAEHLGAALVLHRELPEGVHTDVAMAANNYAVALRALGRLDEAELLHREALDLRRGSAGGDVRTVAESLNNLAGILVDRGDHAAAEAHLREAMSLRRELHGEDHPMVVQALNNLAVVVHMSGDLDRAGPIYEAAIAGYRRLPTAARRELANALTSYARWLQAVGRHDEAVPVLDEALEIQERTLGADHPLTAPTCEALGQLHRALGRHDEAEQAWSRAVRIRRATLPPSHPQLATTLSSYSSFLIGTGQAARAEPLLEEALGIYERSLPPDHWFISATRATLGACFRELGRYEEAEVLLVGAFEELRESRGPSDQHTTMVSRSVIELYERWGRPEAAADFEAAVESGD